MQAMKTDDAAVVILYRIVRLQLPTITLRCGWV